MFISHDMALIRRISHRTGVLYKGTLAECAKTRDLCRDPWHPYTKALLDSVMPPDPLKARKQKYLQCMKENQKEAVRISDLADIRWKCAKTQPLKCMILKAEQFPVTFIPNNNAPEEIRIIR